MNWVTTLGEEKLKIRQLDRDVTGGQLFREKSLENSYGEASILYRENLWWEDSVRMAQSSGEYAVGLMRVCTLNVGISPKSVCIKNIITLCRLVSEPFLSGKCKLRIFIAVCRICTLKFFCKVLNRLCLRNFLIWYAIHL